MSAATISLFLPPTRRFAWVDAARDVGDGALATARLVVTSAGCAALMAAAVLLLNEGARSTLWSALPVPAMMAAVPLAEPDESVVAPAGSRNPFATAVAVNFEY